MNYSMLSLILIYAIFLFPFKEKSDNLILPTHKNSEMGDAKTVTLNDGTVFDIYLLDPKITSLDFYHYAPNNPQQKIKNIRNLKKQLNDNGYQLRFATNGGLFQANLKPTGLYIENEAIMYPLNLKEDQTTFTNFYSIPPNGVFYIQKNKDFGIVKREDFPRIENVQSATQSGPMLIIDNKINSTFNRQSKSKYIRTGVGITKQGKLIFAISHAPVTFFDFSRIFLYYGCSTALYLDGKISEMYLDFKNIKRPTTKNNFSIIMAVSEKIKS